MHKFLGLLFFVFAFAFVSAAQNRIPAPNDVLGFTPGDDRKLASWAQTVDYFQKLAAASDRVKFETIGTSTIGAPFVYATISAPANLANLEKYKQINQKLADPRIIKSNDKTAQDLIKQGKTIVLITCGVHSNEVGSYLSSLLIAHKLATATNAQTRKILDETIVLLVPSLNPDGVDIIKNWYDKTLGTEFEGTEPPELYHKYVGHDDNRDWYAFTQVETQLTVDKIHNVWHPQIVHDIHQQGAFGARMFLPPYLPPVEPNVPRELVEGYTELGNFMAAEMRKAGFKGITTDSTYDAWTPARAYSHYHGGVRILSETASCKLATPITLKFENLRGSLGYDAKKESANFAPVWNGGEWHLRDITDYMTSAAFFLLNHAADNREKWLGKFYEIGKEAVRPRKDGELSAYVIDKSKNGNERILTDALKRAGVEVEETGSRILINGNSLKIEHPYQYMVRLDQPYAGFAKAMIEPEKYPDLRDEKGQPIPPYDVTAHTLSLLMRTKLEKVYSPSQFKSVKSNNKPIIVERDGNYGVSPVLIYKSFVPSMDEGWTRWVIEQHQLSFWSFPKHNGYTRLINHSVYNADIKGKELLSESKTIIFPDQSPNQILNGFAKGAMPAEYTGGVGKKGVENLRKFVEAGGTLVFLNRASNFAIEQFGLPVRDVTSGLARKDFYIPGSILRTELDTTSPIARSLDKLSIAWFENSPAFEITDDSTAKVIARYPQKTVDILLSGWALGAEKLAGKAALVEVSLGKGKIILFGFRPQYRGQSLATFPLLFNAITEK